MSRYPLAVSSMGFPLHPFVQKSSRESLSGDQESKVSDNSVGTVNRTYNTQPPPSSISSLRSISSTQPGPRNENTVPSRIASPAAPPVARGIVDVIPPRCTSNQASHKSNWGSNILDIPLRSRSPRTPSPFIDTGFWEVINLNADSQESHYSQISSEVFRPKRARGFSFDALKGETLSTNRVSSDASQGKKAIRPFVVVKDHPFRRWMSAAHLTKKQPETLTVRKKRWSLDDLEDGKPSRQNVSSPKRRSGHQKASSWSSTGFGAAVKSATTKLTDPSARLPSQRTQKSRFLRSNRSSRYSNAANCVSMDSSQGSAQTLDEAAIDRATQRRKILEELLSSEESYVADLKVLDTIYMTLASATNVHQHTAEIHRIVQEILRLHEEVYRQLKNIIPALETRSYDGAKPQIRAGDVHIRSIDGSQGPHDKDFGYKIRRSLDIPWLGRSRNQILTSEPREAADVAKAFGRLMGRFFVYEEYGARYEMMLRNMAWTSKNMPDWHAYVRGMEALANALTPQKNPEDVSRKGLTFEDLLIKPIQRICKYPLLFADLYKYTPETDSPDSRIEVEKVLYRIRETAKEINKATNDTQTQARIKQSWHLQDLLGATTIVNTTPADIIFLPQANRENGQSSVPFSVRLLGHASLCGVLYVAYQSKSDLRGNYMLCALFKTHLVLALPVGRNSPFEIIAVIGLANLEMDKADNGRGLQCHTAPFSWKVLFEADQQLYEMIFCACTAREEEQWKADLFEYSASEDQRQADDCSMPAFDPSFLSLSIRPLGSVFGKPGTLIRRSTIQRAATTNPRTNSCQVIIRNTNSLKDGGELPVASDLLCRSQSLLSTNRIPTLAPKRAERQAIEHAMSDVWTRNRLPYPGMNANRGGYLIRTSATSMMRKLSMASLTSNTAKRVVTYTSIAEGSPYTVQFNGQRMNQTDGAHSPPLGGYPFVSSPTHLEDHAQVEAQFYEPSPRSSMTKAIRLSKSFKRKNSCVSEASTVITNQESMEMDRGKGKLRKPKTLLKAFSADGIRGWFT